MSATTVNAVAFATPPPQQTDARQIRFQELVQKYATDLYRYAIWLTRRDDVAQDLVQETMLRAWRSLDKIREPKAVKSWLLTILRRENARRFERYQPTLVELHAEQIVSQHRAYDTSTEAFVLRRAIAELPEDYREPLLLQVIDGYSCKEISKHMGISEGATMTRLFRARQKMRDALTEDGKHPGI